VSESFDTCLDSGALQWWVILLIGLGCMVTAITMCGFVWRCWYKRHKALALQHQSQHDSEQPAPVVMATVVDAQVLSNETNPNVVMPNDVAKPLS